MCDKILTSCLDYFIRPTSPGSDSSDKYEHTYVLTDSAQVRTQAHKCTFEQTFTDSVTHIHPGFSTLHCTLQCWCSACVSCLAAKMRHVRDQECERQPCKHPLPPVSWSHGPLTLLPSTPYAHSG